MAASFALTVLIHFSYRLAPNFYAVSWHLSVLRVGRLGNSLAERLLIAIRPLLRLVRRYSRSRRMLCNSRRTVIAFRYQVHLTSRSMSER
jgi:hypothetical protein